MDRSLPIKVFQPESISYLSRQLVGEDYRERLSTGWFVSLLIWLAVLIATPISIWLAGEHSFPLLASLGVLSQSIATILALYHRWPAKAIARLAAVIVLLTWLVEWIGSNTGFPFGRYHYTALLQPQLLSVPILIPLAWLMMLVPAWGVAQLILASWKQSLKKTYPWLFASIAGLVFTSWDLYLDPQMVQRGLWLWDQVGWYFGIPLSNFAGWWLVSAGITKILNPGELPQRPLLVIYSLTWAFQAIGLGLFWSQPGPAFVGFLCMGFFATLAWRQVWKQSSGR